jgi:drug/metabolite transporter (DMT)-like permease
MRRSTAHVVLFTGLLLVSTAGPFIKSAQIDAYAVAFWRMAASAALFALWALLRRELSFTRSHLRSMIIGGAFMAGHFGLWIRAFDLTSYASNLLLLVVQPVIAALVGARLGEPPTRRTWISVTLATAGLAIIAQGDIQLGPRAILGDMLSILASISITSFYVVTRDARKELPLTTFMAVSMGAGAVAIVPVLALTRAPLIGYSGTSWGWLAGLVLVTTLAGHGTMNFVARYVPMFTLNVVIVLEPALSILMGIPLFGASLNIAQAIGGLILMVAVVVGLQHSTAPAGEWMELE